MKLYICQSCRNALYFENDLCLQCQHPVGFDANRLELISLEAGEDGTYQEIAGKKSSHRYCQNAAQKVCNWLVPVDAISPFCVACSLNRTIPSLEKIENQNRWRRIEVAKHRLVYSLLRLKLPVESKTINEESGVIFDFLADVTPDQHVMTGHDNGVITLNIEEADEIQCTRNKKELGEEYRTLLGHFRHEIGHYYWDLLLKDEALLEQCRKLFGDERIDYAESLKKHYDTGTNVNWTDQYISTYATAHPWEDWAESWAHYLHMMDALETAYAFGIGINPQRTEDEHQMQTEIDRDPYRIADFGRILKMWLPMTFALNSLNRSMGHGDFYPFVISAPVMEKLKFIHDLCGRGRFRKN